MHNPYEMLEYQAKVNGNRTAMSNSIESVTFARLREISARISAKLAALGVKSGDSVFTALAPNVDVIVTAALFHRACISCSSHSGGWTDLPYTPDWIITDRHSASGDNVIFIDQNWFNDASSYPADEPYIPYESDDSICRIVLTSGTTGVSKGALVSLRTFRLRLEQVVGDWLCANGDSLCLMPMGTIGGFFSMAYSWKSGRPYFTVLNPESVITLLTRSPIACLVGAPSQIVQLIDYLQKNSLKLPNLKEVRMAGSLVSGRLVDSILRVLNVEIYSIYGSTETGGVGMVHLRVPSDVGKTAYMRPGMKVEIVDDQGQPLAAGQDGIVRIKGPANIPGYINGVAAESFHEGWFYPGDRGVIDPDGLLRIAARDAELINRGGEKINPVPVDNFLLAYPGVRDAAVFGVENALGFMEMAAVMVVDEAFDFEALQRAIAGKVNPYAVPAHYFRVDEVMRNHMGKPLRLKMGEIFRDQLVKAGRPGF